MRDIVARCLVKDPSKRPTAAQLLEHKFFKTAHEPSYLVKHLLAGLPPVTERVRLMRAGKGNHTARENQAMAAQSQVPSPPGQPGAAAPEASECTLANHRTCMTCLLRAHLDGGRQCRQHCESRPLSGSCVSFGLTPGRIWLAGSICEGSERLEFRRQRPQEQRLR